MNKQVVVTSIFYCLLYIVILSCNRISNTETNYLSYYHVINDAIYLQFKKEYSKADSVFSKAFQLVDRPFYEDCLKAAKNALKLSNKKAAAHLALGIDHGLRLEKVSEDSAFMIFVQSQHWHTIEASYQKKRARYESTIDHKLGQSLLFMHDMDQIVRTNPEESISPMEEIDRMNRDKLIQIIAENGYPGYSMVGEEIGRSFPIMFHHFSLQDNKTHFNDVLNEAMRKGEISPFRNAIYRDYNRITNGQKETTYGFHGSPQDGERVLYPIEDFQNVNKRRYEMGLAPLEQYLEMNNIVCHQNILSLK